MPSIKYTHYKGVRVSKKWAAVLKRAEEAGVRFELDSGHRTINEQMKLFRQNMRRSGFRWVPRPGRPLTAIPTPLAPHIRLGRADHALDVNSRDGGAKRLAIFLRSDPRNARVSFPVRGEDWHLEINSRDLTRLWRKYR